MKTPKEQNYRLFEYAAPETSNPKPSQTLKARTPNPYPIVPLVDTPSTLKATLQGTLLKELTLTPTRIRRVPAEAMVVSPSRTPNCASMKSPQMIMILQETAFRV